MTVLPLVRGVIVGHKYISHVLAVSDRLVSARTPVYTGVEQSLPPFYPFFFRCPVVDRP